MRADDLDIPGWAKLADRVLGLAARRVASATRVTARNHRLELERITPIWRAGRQAVPNLDYQPAIDDLDDLRRALEELDRVVGREGALGELYARRAEELSLEAEIARAIGSRALMPLASARFGRAGDAAARADALALAWTDDSHASASQRLRSADRAEGAELVRTDDDSDPRSLVSRLRAEIGRRRLPVRISLRDDLAPLAACAAGVVLVARGRFIDERAAARTALHEIEGHALPELRASASALGLFKIGTRAGADEQEGYALVLEERAGFLDAGRRAELGLRHLAARALHEGASFVDACTLLLERGASVEDGVRIAMRAHRGGADGNGGLGRERVYLGAYVRVSQAFLDDPTLEDVVSAGRVAVEAAPTLRPHRAPSAFATAEPEAIRAAPLARQRGREQF